MNWLRYGILIIMLIISDTVSSHPGHNHSDWSSDVFHLALSLNVLLVVGFVVYGLIQQLRLNRAGKRQSETNPS